MKLKLSAFADEAGASIIEQVSAMKENGVEFLEIRGVDGINVSKITLEKAKEVRRILDGNGLLTWSIGAPTGKIKIWDDFLPHLDEFKHMLEIAEILGAKHFRIFSFYGCDGSLAARAEVMLRLSRFVEAASCSGILLCHENEKSIYGESAENCLDILKSVPQIKGIFDPANFVQAGEDTLKAWEMLSPYIEYLHIKDSLADGSIVPAGKGIGNLKYITSEYIKNGGTVATIEPHLTVFEGFENLEADEKTVTPEYSYKSQREAFNIAVNAFKNLI